MILLSLQIYLKGEFFVSSYLSVRDYVTKFGNTLIRKIHAKVSLCIIYVYKETLYAKASVVSLPMRVATGLRGGVFLVGPESTFLPKRRHSGGPSVWDPGQ